MSMRLGYLICVSITFKFINSDVNEIMIHFIPIILKTEGQTYR